MIIGAHAVVRRGGRAAMAFTRQQVAMLEKQAEDAATLTRAEARRFLLKSGIINAKGGLAARYRNATPSQKLGSRAIKR